MMAGIEAGEHHGPMVTTRGQTDHYTNTIMFVGRFASKSRQFLHNGCQTDCTLSIRPDFSRQTDRDALLALACDPKSHSGRWTGSGLSRKFKCLVAMEFMKRKCSRRFNNITSYNSHKLENTYIIYFTEEYARMLATNKNLSIISLNIFYALCDFRSSWTLYINHFFQNYI